VPLSILKHRIKASAGQETGHRCILKVTRVCLAMKDKSISNETVRCLIAAPPANWIPSICSVNAVGDTEHCPVHPGYVTASAIGAIDRTVEPRGICSFAACGE